MPTGAHDLRSSLWNYGAIVAFSLLWADLIRQLSYTWSTSEQYAYGWFVPLLALGLLWRRWSTRPVPQLSTFSFQLSAFEQSASPCPRVSPLFSFPLSAFCFLLCLLLLPLRVIHEINQDWPLITWPLALIVVALTLYAFHLAGPPSSVSSSPVVPLSSSPSLSGPVVRAPWSFFSPWVRHFAFPICFILLAVRWPWRIENAITQGLMQVVANLTVELLGWLNIPASQHGNLIEVATGTVGIDEACSGIRSFQSTLMAALFLGELYLLRWPVRLLLVGIGLAAAFMLNVSRTLLLTWQANKSGLSAIDKWHDPAGFTIAVACFLLLWLLAWLIKRKMDRSSPISAFSFQLSGLPSGPPSSQQQTPSASPCLRVSVSSPQPPSPGPGSAISDFSFQLSAFPRRFMLACGLWSLCVVGLTELWYRAHKVKDWGELHWSVTFPETKPAFQKIDLPPRTVKLMRYDLGAAAKWREGDSEWNAYFFQWQPISMQSMMRARYHRPEICLTGSGLRQVSESAAEYFDTARLKLPFRTYTFSGQGQMLYVFFCLWQDGDEQRKGMRWYKQEDRLLMVLEGRRLFGQQTLEIMISGVSSMAEAEQALRQRLPSLIRIDRQATTPAPPTDH